MSSTTLADTVQQLTANYKGLLAMDESIATCNKRFAELGIPQTEEYRRRYRELLVTTKGLEQYISGAILCDETIKQRTGNKIHMIDILNEKGIITGIKVDEGTTQLAGFPSEKITEGIDGLAHRLSKYYSMGARFAKWRAVITIGEKTPTETCIKANAYLLARYAALCQETGLVAVVEPEVLMDGNHSMEKCAEITQDVLYAVFNALYHHHVELEGIILKPNMILPGKTCSVQHTAQEIARETISCFRRCVPAAVQGVAFLSGGQSPQQAAARLNAMHHLLDEPLPWVLTFSFSRAIQQPVMKAWNGNNDNVSHAQQILLHRSYCCHAACMGTYTAAIDNE